MKLIAGVIGFVITSLCFIVDAADTDTPIIGAHLGSGLDPSHVKEDNDIYITCDIEPNTTSVYKVKWFHDGKEVSTDFKAGIIIADKNLVLQNIKKPTSGNYHCEAITDKGALKSDPIPIDVKNVNEASSSENNTTFPPSTEIPTTVNPENSTDASNLLEGRSDLGKDSENVTSSTQNTTTVPTTTEAATTVTPKNSTDTTSSPTERPGSSKDPKNVKSFSPNSTTLSGTTVPETTTSGTTTPGSTTSGSTTSGSTAAGTTTSRPTTSGSTISKTAASGTTTSRTTASRTTPSRTTPSRPTTSRSTASRTTPSRTTASRTTPSRTTASRTTASRTTVPANTEIPTTAIPEPNPFGTRFDIPGFNQDFLNDRQPGQNFTKQFHHGDCNIQYDRSDRGDTHVTWKRGNDDIEMNVRPDGNIGQNWNFPGVQIRLIATSAGEKEQNWNFGPAQYILKQLPNGGLATRWIVRSYSFGTPMMVEDWDTLNFYRNLISAWCDRFYFLVDERNQCIIY